MDEPITQESPQFDQPTAATLIENDARLWGTLCRLSALSVFVTGVGLVLGPLICWLLKRNDHPFVDQQGKEAVNFQLSMLLYKAVGAVLIPCFGIGIFVILALFVTNIVLVILASIKANNGISVRYPYTIRFLT